jgi:hypothetical protein
MMALGLYGSSYYDLPGMLRSFTANIGRFMSTVLQSHSVLPVAVCRSRCAMPDVANVGQLTLISGSTGRSSATQLLEGWLEMKALHTCSARFS